MRQIRFTDMNRPTWGTLWAVTGSQLRVIGRVDWQVANLRRIRATQMGQKRNESGTK